MSDIERGKEILQNLLTDDVIQIRPSDRERFMDEWRESMALIEQAARQATASGEVEPVITVTNLHEEDSSQEPVATMSARDWLRLSQLTPGTKLYTHPPAKVPEGIEAAARYIENKASDYDLEHGATDPFTGAREYPGDGAEYYNDMMELAEEVRALTTPTPATTPEAEWVKCSERMPTMKDADQYGQVIGWNSDNGESVIGPPCDFKNAPWLTHWMPTGLSEPTPPQEQ